MINTPIVLSGAGRWTRADGTKPSTGCWAEELVLPHERFAEAGYNVDIATPNTLL